ncbi:MAG TPA: ABC transporter substrate-binding protein [Bradyrhizobium sp.]|nr:ABC transporter substrate-binding protein [Bradyrhizobium sp.]
MPAQSPTISRRKVLHWTAAAATLPLAVRPSLAGESLLRAGITGFSVINTLDPAKASLLSEYYVIWAAFNSLLKFDSNMQITGDLAETFRVIDSTTLEFKLRSGVKFHDGSKLTSDDVKFSLERLADEAIASPNRAKVAAIADIRILDPDRLQIITRAPFAPLLTYLTNTRTGTQIVPYKTLKTAGDEAFGKKPIGTGAYVVKQWNSNESVELAAFPEYFQPGTDRIERVLMPLIPEESSGTTALLGGQIDLTSTAPFADVPGLRQKPTLRVYTTSGLNTRYIALNNRKPPFDDVHFRRALSMAFDRNVLVKAVVFGEGTVSPGLLPPALQPRADLPLPEAMTFNPERARGELAKSRYQSGTEATVLIWGSNWWRRIGELFVAQTNQVLGTKLSLQVGDPNAVFARLRAGDFQAAVWGWLGLVDPDEYLGEMLGKGAFRNYQGYENPSFEELLAQGRAELDTARRRQIYHEAEQVMLADMPLIPCFCSNVHNLATSRLSGFEQLPYSNYGDQFANLKLT